MTLSDYPNTWPAMTLDFRNSRQLDPRITLTRDTEGRGNVNGEVHTFPANVARLVEGGLLVEPEGINRVSQSQDFTNANWSNFVDLGADATQTITANAAVAPDGTTTANRITRANDGQCRVSPLDNFGNGDWAHSCFFKNDGHNFVQLAVIGETVFFVNFDLTTGEIGGSNGVGSIQGNIEEWGGGWWRCVLSYNISTSGSARPFFALVEDLNSPNQISFNTSNVNGSVLAWGFQSESGVGARASSYIPTSGSQATRGAEQATIQGNDFTELWNVSNGTWVAFGGPTWDITENVSFVRVDADSSNFYMAMSLKSNAVPRDNYLAGTVKDTDTSSWNMEGPNIYGDYKVAMTWEANPEVTATISVDGTSLTQVTGNELNPAINKMQIGNYRGQFNHIYRIASLSYYTSTFTTDQLEAITEQ